MSTVCDSFSLAFGCASSLKKILAIVSVSAVRWDRLLLVTDCASLQILSVLISGSVFCFEVCPSPIFERVVFKRLDKDQRRLVDPFIALNEPWDQSLQMPLLLSTLLNQIDLLQQMACSCTYL